MKSGHSGSPRRDGNGKHSPSVGFQPCRTSTKAFAREKCALSGRILPDSSLDAVFMPGAPLKSPAHRHPRDFTRSVSKRKRRVYGLTAGTHRNSTPSALCSSICLSIVMAVTARGRPQSLSQSPVTLDCQTHPHSIAVPLRPSVHPSGKRPPSMCDNVSEHLVSALLHGGRDRARAVDFF